MLTDRQLTDALAKLIVAIEVPPIPLASIRSQIERPKTVMFSKRRRDLRFPLAAAAALVLGIALAMSSESLVQGVEQAVDRYRAALKAAGGWAPPSPPENLRQAMLKQAWSAPNVSIETARSRVPFALLAPAGLPNDITKATIRVVPTLVYDPARHAWQLGPHIAWFVYERAHGRSFNILVNQFDPRSAPPGKYKFETDDANTTGTGRPTLIKHDVFAWRNGSQVTTAIDGTGITATEIAAIRQAMHGIPIPGRWPYKPEPGELVQMFPAPSP